MHQLWRFNPSWWWSGWQPFSLPVDRSSASIHSLLPIPWVSSIEYNLMTFIKEIGNAWLELIMDSYRQHIKGFYDGDGNWTATEKEKKILNPYQGGSKLVLAPNFPWTGRIALPRFATGSFSHHLWPQIEGHDQNLRLVPKIICSHRKSCKETNKAFSCSSWTPFHHA